MESKLAMFALLALFVAVVHADAEAEADAAASFYRNDYGYNYGNLGLYRGFNKRVDYLNNYNNYLGHNNNNYLGHTIGHEYNGLNRFGLNRVGLNRVGLNNYPYYGNGYYGVQQRHPANYNYGYTLNAPNAYSYAHVNY